MPVLDLRRSLEKALRLVTGFARWYTRRHPVVRHLLFIALFFGPVLLYAWSETPREMARQLGQLGTLYTATAPTEPVPPGLEPLPCHSLFADRLVRDSGRFSLTDNTCYLLNRTAVLYRTWDGLGVIYVLGDPASRDAYVFSLNHVMVVGGVTVRHVAVLIYGNATDPVVVSGVESLLEGLGLHDEFCTLFRPAPPGGWCQDCVPDGLYQQVCLRPRH